MKDLARALVEVGPVGLAYALVFASTFGLAEWADRRKKARRSR